MTGHLSSDHPDGRHHPDWHILEEGHATIAKNKTNVGLYQPYGHQPDEQGEYSTESKLICVYPLIITKI